MAITLNKIGIECNLRMVNIHGDSEVDMSIDASNVSRSAITSGFCDVFFMDLANGRKKGNTNGSFVTILKAQKWADTAFTSGNEVILSSTGIVNKYQNEVQNVYEVQMEKLYDGQNGNAFAGSSNIGYFTDLEIYFIPENVLPINAKTGGKLIFTSTQLRLSSQAVTIQTGQALKGMYIAEGNGSSDIAKYYTTLKFTIA